MIEASTSSVVTDVTTVVELGTELPDVVVDVSKSITAEVSPETYVLVSDGMFSGNATGGIPNWLLNAIEQELTVGDGNLSSVLAAMQVTLDAVQLGVNQNVTQIENLALSQSTLATTLGSQIDGNSAAIIDVAATRVTEAGALAIASTAIGTTFGGNVDAYIGNLASVYTAPGSATATNISTLQTSYNDQTARIDTIEYATTDEFGYSLGASKLATAPDGSITGWQFTDGTGIQSEFKIQATNFSISDGTTGYVPFSITGTDINFLGKVTFDGLGIDSNSTTIDGGKITTNTLQADRLKAGVSGSTVWTGGGLISANFNGNAYGSIGTPTTGFRLSSNAAGTSADPSIYGAYIKGGTIASVEMLSMVVASNQLLVKAEGYPSNYGRIHYKEGIDGSNGDGTYSKGITRYSSSLAGPAAGVGLIEDRICDRSFSIVGLTGRVASASGTQSAAISRSIDGGIYSTIATIPFGGFGTEFYYRDTGLPVSFTSVVYKVTVSADGYLYYVTVDINNT